MPFIQHQDVSLLVTQAGAADHPALMFSNSLGTTHRMWDAVVAELGAEYRCIRYDTRGHGASTNAARPFEIADLAADAVAIMDALGLEKVHFVGLSLGGMTGQALAIHYPERLSSLALLATTAFMPSAQAWLDRAALVRQQGMGAILEATLLRWFTPGFLAQNPPVIARIADDFRAIDPHGYAACCEAIARMDLRGGLGTIRTPTLILAGAQDPATPPALSEALHAAIAKSQIRVLDPAAHLLATEQPQDVAHALSRHVAAALR